MRNEWIVFYPTRFTLTFFCRLVLAVLVGAGSPGAPRGHLALHWAANVAELGGVRGRTQTQVAVHWSHSCGEVNHRQSVSESHLFKRIGNLCAINRFVFLPLNLRKESINTKNV